MYNIASWNVNGLRACAKKNFRSWAIKNQYNLLCLQGIKALPEQLPEEILHLDGYQGYFYPAKKKGYSGVALYIRQSAPKPLEIGYGIGISKYDDEGRTIWAEFPKFLVFNCYFPNGQRDHGRVPYKLSYSRALLKFAQKKSEECGKPLIICGDYNTAHHEIDLSNPKTNQKTTGFLPNERRWLDQLEKQGFVDIFRKKHPEEAGHHTWWSYRSDCRARNIGWRIDYFFISSELEGKVHEALISPKVLGSDHCPITLSLK